MQILFYILILVTGGLSIYTDILDREIKNTHMAVISIIALVLYSILNITGKMTLTPQILFNPLTALILGFSLYLPGLWKAGDAKLFLVYSILLPVNRYEAILPFSCMVLFINTFLLSFVILLPVIIKDIIKNKDVIIKEVILKDSLKFFVKVFIITFCVSGFTSPIFNLIIRKNSLFFSFIILYAGYTFMYSLFDKIKNKLVIILLCTVGLALRYAYYPQIFNPARLLAYLKFVFGFSLVFHVLSKIIEAQKKKKERIPLAPFLFLGAVLVNTPFLEAVIRFMRSLWR